MNIIKSEKQLCTDMREVKIHSQPATIESENTHALLFGYKRKKNDPIDFDFGWIFWDETWANFNGPFKSEYDAREALDIYCEVYLRDSAKELSVEQQMKLMDRYKELKLEGVKYWNERLRR